MSDWGCRNITYSSENDGSQAGDEIHGGISLQETKFYDYVCSMANQHVCIYVCKVTGRWNRDYLYCFKHKSSNLHIIYVKWIFKNTYQKWFLPQAQRSAIFWQLDKSNFEKNIRQTRIISYLPTTYANIQRTQWPPLSCEGHLNLNKKWSVGSNPTIVTMPTL
jgi:hypothetical protein